MVTWREEAELGSLFVEHDAFVRRLVRRRVGRPELVDDITGEVWAAAAAAFQDGRASDVTASWLATVAKRRVADHWRRAASERRRFERLAVQRDPLEPSSLERVLAKDQAMPGELASETRRLLWLRYVDGWRVNDIADLLEISYSATESRLARARRELRAAHELQQTVDPAALAA